jgi:autotransporter-associated beta strand protein
VIDPGTNTLYVVVKTKETVGGAAHYVQRLHAINTADGTDRAAPFLIGNTTNGNSNNTQIFVYGTGDGSVTVSGKSVVQFNALREAERGALSLVNNTVYVEWASHGDNGPYHGWVAQWNVANLATTGFALTGVLNTSPNDGLAGIWQGGGRLVFDPDTSVTAFYFETGNGSGGAPTLNASGFPTNANYNEALVKVIPDPSSTAANQNANGWGLKVADYFIPYNVAALDGADSDFGSGAPMILPDSAGIAGHAHLMVASGKEGKIYVIDRDNMGHYSATADHVLNVVPDGSGHNTPPVQLGGSLGTPAYFNGKIYWVSGYSSSAYAYTLNSNGTLSVASQTSATFGYLPGSAVVSANGSNNGIVWIMDRNANLIRAYDATTLATELWNSGQKAGGGDSVGAVVKFAVPAVANGEVFVGNSNSLLVYGLVQPATAVPNQPTLSATPLSGSTVNLTWTDTTVAPNTASNYSIEDSTDGTNFSVVTTAPAGSTSIAIGGLQVSTKYYFRIRGLNSVGYSPYSNVANATTTSTAAALDFSGGFVGSTSKLTFNGTTALNGPMLELTNGGGSQAASAFSTLPIDITRFSTQFTSQLSAGSSTADGFTFCIQGVGPNALGPAGGGLGYGGSPGGINNSIAVKFDLYNNAGEGVDSTGLYTNGASPFNVGSIDLTPSGIDLHSGDAINVTMNYDGTNLIVTLTDPSAGVSATQTYPIDIPGTVGDGTAYLGFTGGTGGLTATQDILNWTYSPTTVVVSPNAPSGLGGSPASATSINLNWTNNAANQTGFNLDRAADPDFTQSLITQTLPATPNTFTDTATGLAPGSTYYYRLRAFNSAGDSGNSNVVAVAIPVAPPKPTDQQITGVTSTEIDISWQDNAGHQADGYHILRAVNHGTFTQVAALPLTSRTPPSTYTWSDTNLTPGSYYEYHIVAYNVSGNNDFAGVNATTITLPPAGLAAAPGQNAAELSWTASVGAVSYNIYRSAVTGGEGGQVLATAVTATSYTDATAVNGTTYYYVVTAVNGNTAPLPAESAFSNEASVIPGTTLAAPTNLQAIGTPYNAATAHTVLTWNAVAGVTSYNVYRGRTSGGETLAASNITTTGYMDNSVAFNSTYYYRVTALNPAGEGPKSSEVSITPVFRAYINFTAATTDSQTVGGISYQDDFGNIYGSRGNGLTYGWNADNTANARDRNVGNSPNELYDSFLHMQKPSDPNAWWGIAVPNGTYTVHLISGDPSNTDSAYEIYASDGSIQGSTLTTINPVLAISGQPSTAQFWFENTVQVTTSSGMLFVSNAPGSSNDKIDEIDLQLIAVAHAQWGSTTSGSWNSGNWIDASSGTTVAPPGLRGVVGDSAVFSSAAGSPITLYGANPSVAAMTFNNSIASFVVSQGTGGTLSLATFDGNSADIAVVAGSHTISAPLMLDDNLVITPSLGASLAISGPISGAGKSLTVNGPGTLTLGGTGNGYSGGTIVTAGKLVVTSSQALPDGSSLTIDAGGAFTFNSAVSAVAAGRLVVGSNVSSTPIQGTAAPKAIPRVEVSALLPDSAALGLGPAITMPASKPKTLSPSETANAHDRVIQGSGQVKMNPAAWIWSLLQSTATDNTKKNTLSPEQVDRLLSV